jgi:hypothetical protein
MQNDDFDQKDTEHRAVAVSGPEDPTTASGDHPCGQCRRALAGRKRRFCSDRCRMRHRRIDQLFQRTKMLAKLYEAVDQIALELLGKDGH